MRRLFVTLVSLAASIAPLTLVGCSDKTEVDDLRLDIKITAGSVTASSINVKFEPQADAASFTAAIGTAADQSAFEAGTLEGILSFTGNTAQTHLFEGLSAATEYTLCASARDAAGKRGKTATLKVTTAEEEVSDLSIVIEGGEITLTTAAITFKPGADVASYRVAIGYDTDESAFADGTMKGVIAFATGEEQTHTFEGLIQKTDYTVFAVAESADGEQGEIVKHQLTTLVDDFSLRIVPEKVGAPSARLTLEPQSRVASFAALLSPADAWAAYGDEETRIYYLEMYAMYGMATTGTTEPITKTFPLNGICDSEYVVAYLAYDDSGQKRYYEHLFRTPKNDPTLDAPGDVIIEMVSFDAASVKLNFKMGTDTYAYYFAVISKADFDANFYSDEDAIQSLLMTAYMNVSDQNGANFSGLTADTEYVVAAVAVNANGMEGGYGSLSKLAFRTAAQ
jgi:hypothetical protein